MRRYDDKTKMAILIATLRLFLQAYEKWNERKEGGEDDLHYAARETRDVLARHQEAKRK